MTRQDIIDYRKSLGLTPQQMAKFLHVPMQNIYQWERENAGRGLTKSVRRLYELHKMVQVFAPSIHDALLQDINK